MAKFAFNPITGNLDLNGNGESIGGLPLPIIPNTALVSNSSSEAVWDTTLLNNFTYSGNLIGNERFLLVENTDSTDSLSTARIEVKTGGDNAGSPYMRQVVNGTVSYCQGVANTDTDNPWRLRGDSGLVTPQSGNGITILEAYQNGNLLIPNSSKATVGVGAGVTNATGDGTVVNVIYDTVFYNIGGGYDNSTGLYTAPLSGYYNIEASVTLEGILSTHTTGEITIVASGNIYKEYFNPFNSATAAGDCTAKISMTVFVSAGQTIGIQVMVNGGTQVVGLKAAFFASFSTASFTLVG